LLVWNDGRRMKIYGSDDHLIEAQDVLFVQSPQDSRTEPSTRPWSLSITLYIVY
jgi:hypothetical protein